MRFGLLGAWRKVALSLTGVGLHHGSNEDTPPNCSSARSTAHNQPTSRGTFPVEKVKIHRSTDRDTILSWVRGLGPSEPSNGQQYGDIDRIGFWFSSSTPEKEPEKLEPKTEFDSFGIRYSSEPKKPESGVCELQKSDVVCEMKAESAVSESDKKSKDDSGDAGAKPVLESNDDSENPNSEKSVQEEPKPHQDDLRLQLDDDLADFDDGFGSEMDEEAFLQVIRKYGPDTLRQVQRWSNMAYYAHEKAAGNQQSQSFEYADEYDDFDQSYGDEIDSQLRPSINPQNESVNWKSTSTDFSKFRDYNDFQTFNDSLKNKFKLRAPQPPRELNNKDQRDFFPPQDFNSNNFEDFQPPNFNNLRNFQPQDFTKNNLRDFQPLDFTKNNLRDFQPQDFNKNNLRDFQPQDFTKNNLRDFQPQDFTKNNLRDFQPPDFKKSNVRDFQPPDFNNLRNFQPQDFTKNNVRDFQPQDFTKNNLRDFQPPQDFNMNNLKDFHPQEHINKLPRRFKNRRRAPQEDYPQEAQNFYNNEMEPNSWENDDWADNSRRNTSPRTRNRYQQDNVDDQYPQEFSKLRRSPSPPRFNNDEKFDRDSFEQKIKKRIRRKTTNKENPDDSNDFGYNAAWDTRHDPVRDNPWPHPDDWIKMDRDFESGKSDPQKQSELVADSKKMLEELKQKMNQIKMKQNRTRNSESHERRLPSRRSRRNARDQRNKGPRNRQDLMLGSFA